MIVVLRIDWYSYVLAPAGEHVRQLAGRGVATLCQSDDDTPPSPPDPRPHRTAEERLRYAGRRRYGVLQLRDDPTRYIVLANFLCEILVQDRYKREGMRHYLAYGHRVKFEYLVTSPGRDPLDAAGEGPEM